MDLKQIIKESMEKEIVGKLEEIDNLTEGLSFIDSINPENAKYRINLKGTWSAYDESIEYLHEGSLREAIVNAERKLMKVNNRIAVQAEYRVEILLGEKYYPVPELIWTNLKERNRND